MKSVIVYYSFTGNTKKTAELTEEFLRSRGYSVHMLELRALDESDSFFSQSLRAFQHMRAQLTPISADMSGYDLICLGSPVWAFAPSPAMNTFLDKCSGMRGKKVVIFTTYGSGTGNARCLAYMEKMLHKKGVGEIGRFSVQQNKVAIREHLQPKLEEIFGVTAVGA